MEKKNAIVFTSIIDREIPMSAATADDVFDITDFIMLKEYSKYDYNFLPLDLFDIERFYSEKTDVNDFLNTVKAVAIEPNEEYFNKAWAIARLRSCNGEGCQ